MKLTRQIPARRETVEFYALKKDFSNYGEAWRKHRPDMKCGWCATPFKEGDTVALGFRHKHVNMLLCQICVDAALRGPGEGKP